MRLEANGRMRRLLPLLLLYTAPCHGSSDLVSGLELDGAVRLDVVTEERFEKATFGKEAQFGLTVRPDESLRAVTDVKLSSESRALELRELFLEYGSGSENRLAAGQAKKEFGRDWDLGTEERLTLERGAIYRKLGTLSYVGRDSMVGCRIGAPGQAALSHAVSLHTSEGMNAAGIYQLTWRVGTRGRLDSYSLLQAQSLNRRWMWAEAQAVAYSAETSVVRWETEWFAGRDFIETDYSSKVGIHGDVFFSALSFAAAWKSQRIEPFARMGVILHDLTRLGSRTGEGILGARFFLGKRAFLGAQITLLRTSIEGFKTSGKEVESLDSGTSGLLTLRYFF